MHTQLIRADNPSPYTLAGTNTWVIIDGGEVIVADPGPASARHLRRIAEAVRGARGVAVVLTHGHVDHAEAALRVAAMVDAPVRAADPRLCQGGSPLADGEQLRVGGLAVEVIAAPGHTQDSVCFAVTVDHALLTGDTVLGAGSSLVAWPDGNLGAYLRTLRRLAEFVADHAIDTLLPGHGPVRTDAAAALSELLQHREQRLERIRSALRNGARDVDEVYDAVYRPEVVPELSAAAYSTLLAQLAYVRDIGELPADFADWEAALSSEGH